MIRATSRPTSVLPGGFHPCKRCGQIREARPNAVLCADCRFSMPAAEKRLWMKAA